jgi:hypothetical protein
MAAAANGHEDIEEYLKKLESKKGIFKEGLPDDENAFHAGTHFQCRRLIPLLQTAKRTPKTQIQNAYPKRMCNRPLTRQTRLPCKTRSVGISH